MEWYRFENGMLPQTQRPVQWKDALILAEPEELADLDLPQALLPPEETLRDRGTQYCRLTIEPDRAFGQLSFLERQGRPAALAVFCWAKDCLLLVGRTEKTKRMVDRLREMHSDITVDGSFFVNLLLLLVANGPDRVQQLETQASTLEQNVLCDQTAGFIHQMSCLRKELNQISRYFTQLNDFASTLIENASERFDQMGLQKLNYFLRKVDVLREDLQIVREYVTQVSGVYQSQVAMEQNRVMKTLTVVTTVFLPLSLITGWYGMNFMFMPELRWEYGYPFVIGISAVVLLLCILFFRHKRYW